MRRCLAAILFLLTLASHVEVRAQYYSVNIDLKTVAAMVGAYGTESAAEAFYNEQVKSVLKDYSAAEVAAAGIFSSKYMDRQALTELGIWSNSTENYYYRRIYSMVSSKIMPKIWTVAGMMLRSPQNAMYWGTYLMKICDETKSLCMQFESVVTSGTLSFGDIAFLQVSSQIADMLSLSELGGVGFREILDDFSKAGDNLTKENLKADIDRLYSMGAGLASAGASNLAGQILQSSNFNDLFSGKIGAAITIADNYSELFHSFDEGIGPAIMGIIGGEDGLSNLFEFSDYNLTSWIDDYAREGLGQYYTQRWYIYRQDSGSETLCQYTPPTGRDDILDGSHWYRISTSDSGFSPTASQRESILSNSESHAGWSRSMVSSLNSQNDDYTYTFSSSMLSYLINSSSGKLKKKAYAYSITVTRSWDITEEVYEDVFDSYSMDLATFQAQMNARLSEFNDNEEGYVYKIGTDQKNWYQTTDEKKIAGIETATISVTCSNGATLSEGSTQYKCDKCSSSLSSHTRECSMMTTVTDQGTDTSELQSQGADLQAQIDQTSENIAQIEKENQSLLSQIREADLEDAAVLRQTYNSNLDRIASMKTELQSLQKQLNDINSAIEEADEGEQVQTDDYNRIPAIMQQLQSSFDLTWQDAGSWSGYTFTRHASIPNIRGTVTFTATLSIARKPKWFLGIKIRRAIVQIDWKLTTEYSDTQVVDILTFDDSMTDQQKADEVNRKVSEVARQHPSCKVSVEYARSETVPEDETSDTYHLLWSSDRLEIAREIDTRITRIYSDLVSLEKMMSYKRDFLDILKDIAPYVNDNEGRRMSILEECHERWMQSASGRNRKDDRTGE